MDHIPLEMLDLILSFINHKHWFNVMLTCQLWLNSGRRTFHPGTNLTPSKAITHAAKKGFVIYTKCLLEDRRVDPFIRSCAPLRWACSEGHLEIIQLLLDTLKSDAKINLPSASLLQPVKNERQDIVSVLLEKQNIQFRGFKVENSAIISTTNPEMIQLLLSSSRLSFDAGVINHLISRWDEVILHQILNDARFDQNSFNVSFLAACRQRGSCKFLEIIMKNPRGFGHVNPFSPTILSSTSCDAGSLEVLRFLAAMPEYDPGSAPALLGNLCKNATDEFLLEFLQDHRVIVTHQNGEALLKASTRGLSGTVEKLLQHNWPKNYEENFNKSFLVACKNGFLPVVQMLGRHPLVSLAKNDNECLVWASWKGHKEIVRELLKNEIVSKGTISMAQFRARQFNRTDVIEILDIVVSGIANVSLPKNPS